MKLPIFANISGIELPKKVIGICEGIALKSSYACLFSAPMVAVSPPPNSHTYNPGPWAAVKGGQQFESKVEIEISERCKVTKHNPETIIWLIAAILRLQVPSPVRITSVSSVSNKAQKESDVKREIELFESSVNQFGVFKNQITVLDEHDVDWLITFFPVLDNFFHDEKFNRAFVLYEQAQWCQSLSTAFTMAWTSLETLFEIGQESKKTKALCNALSNYVGQNKSDRDRAYQIIKDLAVQRGRLLHAGRPVTSKDTLQLLNLSKVAFRRVIIEDKLL